MKPTYDALYELCCRAVGVLEKLDSVMVFASKISRTGYFSELVVGKRTVKWLQRVFEEATSVLLTADVLDIRGEYARRKRRTKHDSESDRGDGGGES